VKTLKTHGFNRTILQDIRDYLETIFLNRWIRRRETIEWPVRIAGFDTSQLLSVGLFERSSLYAASESK